jgi:hypothetical protein
MSIEAMEQALEALKLIDEFTPLPVAKYTIKMLCEAIEQAEKQKLLVSGQEPVAWTLLLVGEHNGIIGKAGDKFLGHPEHYQRVDVYTTPPAAQPAQQEPDDLTAVYMSGLYDGRKQRTWVGLSETERNEIEDFCEMMIGKPAFDAIEAKLKDKNT